MAGKDFEIQVIRGDWKRSTLFARQAVYCRNAFSGVGDHGHQRGIELLARQPQRGAADYDQEHNLYVCPAGKVLSSTGTLVNDGATLLYRASKYDCDACELKPRCCPKMPARKVPRSIHEQARDVARDIAKTDAYVKSRRQRKSSTGRP